MPYLYCASCYEKRFCEYREFAIRCKQGYTHYSAQVCQECFDVFETMLEQLAPGTQSHGPGRQLILNALASQ